MAKIVIGHRMGQGANVKKGLESQGHNVVLISGMLADMKLGDVMQVEQADYGISFCGSGGAGAISAKNKYGYQAKSGLGTVMDGVCAIQDGIQVIGFSFMDTEELGIAIGEAINARD